MIVFPAIDIRGGKCVRLKQGDFDCQTIYGDPLDMAKRFIDAGASWIHVVDLDGARSGTGRNLQIIEQIARLNINVQLGGGLRSVDDIDRRIDIGVRRCVVGSAAVQTPEVVEEAAFLYTGMIAVGIDAKDGKVAIHGWENATETTPEILALRMKGYNVKTIIYTDISRDGMKTGPNIESAIHLAHSTGMDIIASGGVGSMEHVKAVHEAGLKGVIIGKAIYDGDIDLQQALALQEDES